MKQITRDDAVAKLTGRAKYCGDLSFPGMLHACVVRSPVSHGLLRGLDASEALSLPGVRAVLTAADFPGGRGAPLEPKYLVEREIMYKGAPLALIVAEDEGVLSRAREAVKLDIEPLPAVFSPEEALKDGAPVLYGETNEVFHKKIRKGDTAAAFEGAALVLERDYETSWVSHVPLEPDIAVALPDSCGVTVYCPSKCPFYVRGAVATAMALPLSSVRLIMPTCGASYGAKGPDACVIAAQCALAAVKTGRPVRLRHELSESLAVTAKRHSNKLHYKGAFDADGRYRALEIRILGDAGCYFAQTERVAERQITEATGPYVVPNVKTDIVYAYTNNVYADAVRGFGSPQVDFASEQFIDEAAALLGIDPLEIRRRNALREGSVSATSETMKDVTLELCLDTMERNFEYSRKRAEAEAFNRAHDTLRRGVGIAAMYRGEAMGAGSVDAAGVNVNLNYDASLSVYCGTVDVGQGGHTVLRTVVSNVLGISGDKVRVSQVDTTTAPDSGPTLASRSTVLAGNGAREAALILKTRLSAAAMRQWNQSGGEAVFADGHLTSPDGKQSMSFAEAVGLLYAAGESPYASGWWCAPSGLYIDTEEGHGVPYFGYVYGVSAAVVEANTETGEVRVVDFYANHDVGTAISRTEVRKQIYGGVAMGIGYALTEDLGLKDGTVTHTSLRDYRLPTAEDMASVTADIVESPSKLGPFGAKGLGEPTTCITAPAIYNALANATGIHIGTMPIQKEAVLASGRKNK